MSTWGFDWADLASLRPWRRTDGQRILTGAEIDEVERGLLCSNGDGRPQRLSVTAWNIGYGRNYEAVRNALGTTLRSDILLLQEVDRGTSRSRDRHTGGARNVARELARELRMNYAYGVEFQELKQACGGAPAVTGQATLAVHRLDRARTVRFRRQLADWSRGWLGFWQRRVGGRMFLYAALRVGETLLHLYNVHLESRGTDEERMGQARELLTDVQATAGESEPVVVGGDLNTQEGARSPVVGLFLRHGFVDAVSRHVGDGWTTNRTGDRRLDWVLSRNLESTGATVASRFLGSNHRALRVTFRPPSRGRPLSHGGRES